jgi:hypothetical protein
VQDSGLTQRRDEAADTEGLTMEREHCMTRSPASRVTATARITLAGNKVSRRPRGPTLSAEGASSDLKPPMLKQAAELFSEGIDGKSSRGNVEN